MIVQTTYHFQPGSNPKVLMRTRTKLEGGYFTDDGGYVPQREVSTVTSEVLPSADDADYGYQYALDLAIAEHEASLDI